MFSFQDLQSAQLSRGQHQDQRAQQAEASLARGLELLEQYERQPGAEILRQAMGCFIDAMTRQRNRPEPLVMLAYIYYALKSHQLAARYYRLAAAVAPQAPEVLKLQAILTQQARILTVAEQRGDTGFEAEQPVVFDESDLDLLCDQVEALIDAQLAHVMQTGPSPALALASEEQQILINEEARLRETLHHIESQLDVIDTAFDVEDLRRKLRPIEARRKQYQRRIEQADQGRSLLDRILAAQAQVATELAREPLREDALESLLDLCDAIADGIDALESQGLGIQTLAERYGVLVEALTDFQDQLEES